MEIWSTVSRLLWREERATADEPEALTQASGIPLYLRQAVRFTVTGIAATLLTAQIVGIHLAAPVDASGTYGGCNQGCDDQYNRDVQGCTQSTRYVPPSNGGSRNPDPTGQRCLSAAATKRDQCRSRCCN